MGSRGSRLGAVSDERLRSDVAVQLHLATKAEGSNDSGRWTNKSSSDSRNRSANTSFSSRAGGSHSSSKGARGNLLYTTGSRIGSHPPSASRGHIGSPTLGEDDQNRAMLEKAFQRVDVDFDGEVSWEEFQRAAAHLGIGARAEMRVRSAFARFDKDGSGHVDVQEFIDFMCPFDGLGVSGVTFHGSSPTQPPSPEESERESGVLAPEIEGAQEADDAAETQSMSTSDGALSQPDAGDADGAMLRLAMTVFENELSLKQAFKKHSAGRGSLHADGLGAVLSTLGFDVDVEAGQKLIGALDRFGQGEVSLREFMGALRRLQANESDSSESESSSESEAEKEWPQHPERPERQQQQQQQIRRPLQQRQRLQRQNQPPWAQAQHHTRSQPATVATSSSLPPAPRREAEALKSAGETAGPPPSLGPRLSPYAQARAQSEAKARAKALEASERRRRQRAENAEAQRRRKAIPEELKLNTAEEGFLARRARLKKVPAGAHAPDAANASESVPAQAKVRQDQEPEAEQDPRVPAGEREGHPPDGNDADANFNGPADAVKQQLPTSQPLHSEGFAATEALRLDGQAEVGKEFEAAETVTVPEAGAPVQAVHGAADRKEGEEAHRGARAVASSNTGAVFQPAERRQTASEDAATAPPGRQAIGGHATKTPGTAAEAAKEGVGTENAGRQRELWANEEMRRARERFEAEEERRRREAAEEAERERRLQADADAACARESLEADEEGRRPKATNRTERQRSARARGEEEEEESRGVRERAAEENERQRRSQVEAWRAHERLEAVEERRRREAAEEAERRSQLQTKEDQRRREAAEQAERQRQLQAEEEARLARERLEAEEERRRREATEEVERQRRLQAEEEARRTRERFEAEEERRRREAAEEAERQRRLQAVEEARRTRERLEAEEARRRREASEEAERERQSEAEKRREAAEAERLRQLQAGEAATRARERLEAEKEQRRREAVEAADAARRREQAEAAKAVAKKPGGEGQGRSREAEKSQPQRPEASTKATAATAESRRGKGNGPRPDASCNQRPGEKSQERGSKTETKSKTNAAGERDSLEREDSMAHDVQIPVGMGGPGGGLPPQQQRDREEQVLWSQMHVDESAVEPQAAEAGDEEQPTEGDGGALQQGDATGGTGKATAPGPPSSKTQRPQAATGVAQNWAKTPSVDPVRRTAADGGSNQGPTPPGDEAADRRGLALGRVHRSEHEIGEGALQQPSAEGEKPRTGFVQPGAAGGAKKQVTGGGRHQPAAVGNDAMTSVADVQHCQSPLGNEHRPGGQLQPRRAGDAGPVGYSESCVENAAKVSRQTGREGKAADEKAPAFPAPPDPGGEPMVPRQAAPEVSTHPHGAARPLAEGSGGRQDPRAAAPAEATSKSEHGTGARQPATMPQRGKPTMDTDIHEMASYAWKMKSVKPETTDAELLVAFGKRLKGLRTSPEEALAQCTGVGPAYGAGVKPEDRQIRKEDMPAVTVEVLEAFAGQLRYRLPRARAELFLARAKVAMGRSPKDPGSLTASDFLAFFENGGELLRGPGETEAGARSHRPERKALHERVGQLSEREQELVGRLQNALLGPRSLKGEFKKLDAGSAGRINTADFLKALERSGIQVQSSDAAHGMISGDDAAEVIALFDTKGDGTFAYHDFLRALRSSKHEASHLPVEPDPIDTRDDAPGERPDAAQTSSRPTSARPTSSSALSSFVRAAGSTVRSATARPLQQRWEADPSAPPGEFAPPRGYARMAQSSSPVRPFGHKLLSPKAEVTTGRAGAEGWLPQEYDGKLDASMGFVRKAVDVSRRGKAERDREKVKRAFKNWDINGDGRISQQELMHVLKSLDPRFQHEVVSQMFENADSNQDGSIDFNEFVNWLFQ